MKTHQNDNGPDYHRAIRFLLRKIENHSKAVPILRFFHLEKQIEKYCIFFSRYWYSNNLKQIPFVCVTHFFFLS